jgi:hypothetical protein
VISLLVVYIFPLQLTKLPLFCEICYDRDDIGVSTTSTNLSDYTSLSFWSTDASLTIYFRWQSFGKCATSIYDGKVKQQYGDKRLSYKLRLKNCL